MTLPRVLVGGFARSGTSAVTMLVTMLGFHAGKHLKGPAASNPRGFWECLPIRRIAWETAGVNRVRWQHRPETMPDSPLPLRDHPARQQIAKTACECGTEVYKDTYLPMLYQLFPLEARYIVVERDWRAVYASAMAVKPRDIPPEQYRAAVARYKDLARQMARDVETLFVRYEAFTEDFDAEAARLAAFLNKPLDCLGEMRAAWYPNDEWYRRQGTARAQWPSGKPPTRGAGP